MRQAQCALVASGRLDSGHALLEVDCASLGQPGRAGQFLMLRPDPASPEVLRCAAYFSRGGQIAQILLPLEVPDADALLRLMPNETLDVLGPLGQPFVLRPGASRLLIAVRQEPLAPALAAAHWAVRQGCAVALLLQDAAWQPLAELAPDSVECTVAPSDFGRSLREPLRWADQVLFVGDSSHWAGDARRIEEERLRLVPGFASVLVPADFACGVGHCGACAISTRNRIQHVCSDGPIFDLVDLL